VLLCAPAVWFKVKGNAETWNHFLTCFSGLATAFDITLGELHADGILHRTRCTPHRAGLRQTTSFRSGLSSVWHKPRLLSADRGACSSY
jgi:hypothetical protein